MANIKEASGAPPNVVMEVILGRASPDKPDGSRKISKKMDIASVVMTASESRQGESSGPGGDSTVDTPEKSIVHVPSSQGNIRDVLVQQLTQTLYSHLRTCMSFVLRGALETQIQVLSASVGEESPTSSRFIEVFEELGRFDMNTGAEGRAN